MEEAEDIKNCSLKPKDGLNGPPGRIASGQFIPDRNAEEPKEPAYPRSYPEANGDAETDLSPVERFCECE
jgi:hypothetical protein